VFLKAVFLQVIFMKLVLGKECVLSGANPEIVSQLKKELTMKNPAYIEAKKRERWTGNIDKILTFYKEDAPVVYGPTPATSLSFPRGFIRGALDITGHGVVFQDDRQTLPGVDFQFKGKLRPYQDEALQSLLKKDFGFLEALMGSGKTVVALAVIAARKQPTLIVVHNKELLYQWRDRIAKVLGGSAGLVGDSKFDIQPINVGIKNAVRKYLADLPK